MSGHGSMAYCWGTDVFNNIEKVGKVQDEECMSMLLMGKKGSSGIIILKQACQYLHARIVNDIFFSLQWVPFVLKKLVFP